MNTFEHNKKRALLLAALGAIGVALVFLVKPDKKEWHKPAGIVWNTEYRSTSSSVFTKPKMAEVFIPPDVNRGEYFIAWYARKIKA